MRPFCGLGENKKSRRVGDGQTDSMSTRQTDQQTPTACEEDRLWDQAPPWLGVLKDRVTS